MKVIARSVAAIAMIFIATIATAMTATAMRVSTLMATAIGHCNESLCKKCHVLLN